MTDRAGKERNNLPIEEQVCALEQAKELAEFLGDDAPGSSRVWIKTGDGLLLVLREEVNYGISAYTGDELGVLLPKKIITQSRDFEEPELTVFWDENGCNVCYGYYGPGLFYIDYSGIAKTEAQAKAALAIQGLTEGWIKKEDFKY